MGEVGYKEHVEADCASIQYNGGFCTVAGAEGLIIKTQPNTNLMYPRASIPAVKYSINSGQTVLETSVTFE